MLKRKGSKAFWTMLKKLHFSYTEASLYQAKPGSPKCVINTRTVSQSIRDSGKLDIAKDYTFPIKRNEMCLLFAKFKFWGKNCTYIIGAVTRALRWVHHCAKVREAIPFYFSLYIHCICICICTSICIYTPIAFVYVFVGCAKVRKAFLVLLLTLYSYNLRLLLLFRMQPDVVTLRCARYLKLGSIAILYFLAVQDSSIGDIVSH